MLSSLPPGVTDEMMERQANGYPCRCGHFLSEHLEEENNPCDIIGCGCKEFIDIFGDKA